MKNNIKFEICCGSVDDCIIAQKCNADRIELVSAHFLGGLTPTVGTLTRAKELVSIPIMAIIRPRMSGFLYSDEDFNAMCIDAKTMLEAGADGIVFGFLNNDATLDYERTARFKELAGDKQTVFHRAIDIIKDCDNAVEQFIKLGITRILTSGSKENVTSGIENIKHLQSKFGEKIEVLAGGGVRADGVAGLIAQTGVKQVHFGGTSLLTDPSALFNKKIAFGSTVCPPNECYIAVDEKNVNAIVANI